MYDVCNFVKTIAVRYISLSHFNIDSLVVVTYSEKSLPALHGYHYVRNV